MTLQTEFSKWYGDLQLTDDVSVAAARWNMVVSLAKDPKAATLDALTKLAFRSKPSVTAEIKRIRVHFSGGTDSPPGDEELSLLAAATLAAIMEKDQATAAHAATLVAASSCAGRRDPAQPMNLIALAAHAIARLAETARRRPTLAQQRIVPTQISVDKLVPQIQSGDLGVVATALLALAEQTSTALSSMATRQRLFETATQDYVRVQDEELDILWWLIGGRANDFGVALPDVPPLQRPLVLAKELANHTTVLPGPSSLTALFLRAGLDDSAPISIEECVQGLDASWLEKLLIDDTDGRISPSTTPILYAIQHRSKAHGDASWIGYWQSATGLKDEARLSPVEIATAAYRELIVVTLGR